jgi:TolA-binding protein
VSTPAPDAERGTLEAEVALYDRGWQALRRGDRAAAIGVLRTYLARYPRGQLWREASLSLLEALVRSGRLGEADDLASALLLMDAMASRRAELLRTHGEILARRGRCAAAAERLEAALRSGGAKLDRATLDVTLAACRRTAPPAPAGTDTEATPGGSP